MKLSAKIFTLTGALVSALVVACAMTLHQSRSAQAENEQTYQAETLATGYLAEAGGSMWALRLGTAQFRTVTDPAEKEKIVASGKTFALAFQKTLDKIASLPLSPKTLALTAQAKASFAKYTEVRAQWFDLSLKGALADAEVVRLSQLVATASTAVKSLDTLVETIREDGKAGYLQRNADHTRLTTISLAVGGLAVLAAIVLSWMLLRSFSSRMDEALTMARRMKALDLSAAPMSAGDDEVGEIMQALDAMRLHMSRVVASVRENSQSVATSSDEIARGSMDLSQRTEEQASGLQQTAASMEQLASTVQLNAANAKQANTLAVDASRVAVEGGRMVGEVMATMKGIDDSSKKITDIIAVIDGIAFQTNILALNAAVEAARAGEQGRGFAVVASEVRNLSKRSADAAKEVKLLINTSAERVAQGNALFERCGAIMQDVVTSIRGVADINTQISDATIEQSAGMSQINEAVGHMDSATQQNAALVEQSAAAAESLKHQAATLVSAVAVFQVDMV